jgi:hypothetical protein
MPHEPASERVTASVRLANATDAGALALVASATFLETFAGILQGHDIVAHCAREHTPARYAEWLARDAAALWLAEAEPGAAPVGYDLLVPSDLPAANPQRTIKS